MKIEKWFLAILFVVFALSVGAQNKVGDNPTIIQEGSLLELESSTKGLRLPRIALNDETTWTLDGNPVSGMMIFNESGTEPKGIYYWSTDSKKWVRVLNKDELPKLIEDYNALHTSVSNTSSGNILYTTVNGNLGTSVSIINDVKLIGSGNKLTSKVNGIATDLIPSLGSIKNAIGFDASGNLVKQEAASTNKIEVTDNDITATINNITSTAKVITSNVLEGASGKLSSIVNGYRTDLAPGDGTVSKTLGFNTSGDLVTMPFSNTLKGVSNKIISTVNNVPSTLEPQPGTISKNLGFNSTGDLVIQLFSNTLEGKSGSIISTVNGVSNSLTPDVGVINQTLGFDASGKLIKQEPGLLSITNSTKSLGNTITTTVNGKEATAEIVTAIDLTSGSNSITSSVNGISKTLTPTSGTITKTLGFDSGGVLRIQNQTEVPVSNDIYTVDNTITSTVNGVSSEDDIVKSNDLNSGSLSISSAVNGLTATLTPLPGAVDAVLGFTTLGAGGKLVRQSSKTLLLDNSFTASGNTFVSKVNGTTSVLSPGATTVITNTLGFDASGNLVMQPSTSTTVSNQLVMNGNTITSTVNGISSSVGVVTSHGLYGSGNEIRSIVNGDIAKLQPLAGTVARQIGFDADGTLVYSENTPQPVINKLEMTGNALTSTVNNVQAHASIILSNAISSSNGLITTSVNGISTPVGVNVLTNVGAGLSSADGVVSLGGTLNKPTIIDTDNTNTLKITGLQTGAVNDKLVVVSDMVDDRNVLKTLSTSSLPISAATQSALDTKAPLASPTF
ncbi:MAG: hypothetical protein JZU53_08840, partial [Paludibacter sp.]|nr:hypothetical protein [Paludibacter sp.]